MSEQHSPLPWTLVKDSAYAINVVAANKLIVGSAVGGHDSFPLSSEPTMHANAALIVHRVNNYEQIVAALNGIKAHCPCDPDINQNWNAAWDALVAALASVEGSK